MRRTLSVFHLPAEGGVAHPAGELEIEADGHDELQAAARACLLTRDARVRAVHFTPSGMLAYVEDKARS